MAELDMVFTPSLQGLAEEDVMGIIYAQFHEDVEQLGGLENMAIQLRTAQDTGSLVSDETYFAYTAPTIDDLLEFYAEDANQLSAWGRSYARFIEGPGLGFESPTIVDPSRMYAKAETEDIDWIAAWSEGELVKAALKVQIQAGLTP